MTIDYKHKCEVLSKRLLVSEGCRNYAENSNHDLRNELNELRRENAALKHGPCENPLGGLFRKRRDISLSPLVEEVKAGSTYDDTICWRLTRDAIYSPIFQNGLYRGVYHHIDSELFFSLPDGVRAESWWHLCSIVGLRELVARVLYENPEEAQESAVKKAKPVQRGPVIHCQGDYIE
jgi:hypothetical protein